MREERFVDADQIAGLCEWREFATGNVLGLVTDHKETGEDAWYAKYGWYWRSDVLRQLIVGSPDIVLCGSAENVAESYRLFERIAILKKSEAELVSNLSSATRDNPFGKTPKQRQNFMRWQDYLIEGAGAGELTIIEGNDIAEAYKTVADMLRGRA